MELGNKQRRRNPTPYYEPPPKLMVEIDYTLGNLRDTLPRYEAVLAAGEGRKAPNDGALLELKERVARARYLW